MLNSVGRVQKIMRLNIKESNDFKKRKLTQTRYIVRPDRPFSRVHINSGELIWFKNAPISMYCNNRAKSFYLLIIFLYLTSYFHYTPKMFRHIHSINWIYYVLAVLTSDAREYWSYWWHDSVMTFRQCFIAFSHRNMIWSDESLINSSDQL